MCYIYPSQKSVSRLLDDMPEKWDLAPAWLADRPPERQRPAQAAPTENAQGVNFGRGRTRPVPQRDELAHPAGGNQVSQSLPDNPSPCSGTMGSQDTMA